MLLHYTTHCHRHASVREQYAENHDTVVILGAGDTVAAAVLHEKKNKHIEIGYENDTFSIELFQPVFCFEQYSSLTPVYGKSITILYTFHFV